MGCIQVQFKHCLNDWNAFVSASSHSILFRYFSSIFDMNSLWGCVMCVTNFEQWVEWLMNGIDFQLKVEKFSSRVKYLQNCNYDSRMILEFHTTRRFYNIIWSMSTVLLIYSWTVKLQVLISRILHIHLFEMVRQTR